MAVSYYKYFASGMRSVLKQLENSFQNAMVITVVFMRVVEPPLHQIIHMASVWNSFVSTIWAVNMFSVMAIRSMSALVRISLAHFNDVLVHMVRMNVMKMSVM